MSKFSKEPAVSFAADASSKLGRDLWRVKESFSFTFHWKKQEAVVTIPKGYLTDGASVPRIFWGIVPPWGIHGAASIVHDFLCEYLSVMVDGKLVPISRKEADKIFTLAMIESGVPSDKIALISESVETYQRVLGIDSAVWHKDKAALEAQWAANNP